MTQRGFTSQCSLRELRTRRAILRLSALVFLASSALAQEPPPAVFQDAQRLARCMHAMDFRCVVALSDEKAYAALNPPDWDLASEQKRYFETLRRRGVQLDAQALPPEKLYSDDGLLYTFVPYGRHVVDGHSWSTVRWYWIALSRDGGATWRFVDAEGFTSEKIRKVIPGYTNEPLPLSRWIDGTL